MIGLTYAPPAAGASAGTLTVATDAGSPAVALTGTGTATVVVVVTPPPTGATFAPNQSTTLAVSKKSGGGSSVVTVPVRCPPASPARSTAPS